MKIECVLLVDDDQSIRRIAELVLSRVGGWKVILAGSGNEALNILERQKPDVIILDVMMPGMDGPTLFDKLKLNSKLDSTPVIFLTAKVQKEEVSRYLQSGAAGVIYKPFDPKELPDQIRQVVENWESKRLAEDRSKANQFDSQTCSSNSSSNLCEPNKGKGESECKQLPKDYDGIPQLAPQSPGNRLPGSPNSTTDKPTFDSSEDRIIDCMETG